MALSQAHQQAFERFWAAYPRRPENPKAEARKAFAQLMAAKVDPEAVIAAAGRYAAFCAKAGKAEEFIPYASTWLRKRRFEDYADVPVENGHGAHSQSEHPLGWLAETIGEAAWRAWIEPLQVVAGDAPTAILARTQFALDHVRCSWGAEISAHFGDVAWGLQPKDRP